MHSKYDNMNKNEIFYILNGINNHAIASINSMLLIIIMMMTIVIVNIGMMWMVMMKMTTRKKIVMIEIN